MRKVIEKSSVHKITILFFFSSRRKKQNKTREKTKKQFARSTFQLRCVDHTYIYSLISPDIGRSIVFSSLILSPYLFVLIIELYYAICTAMYEKTKQIIPTRKALKKKTKKEFPFNGVFWQIEDRGGDFLCFFSRVEIVISTCLAKEMSY